MAGIFFLNKWRESQNGKGYTLLCSRFDDEAEEWYNAKVFVPKFDREEMATGNQKTGAIVRRDEKGKEYLIIKVKIKDVYKKKKKSDDDVDDENESDEDTKKSKQAKTKKSSKEKLADFEPEDDDLPF